MFSAWVLVLACVCPIPAFAQDSWVQMGPLGGRVTAIVVDPGNPAIVYAGLQSRGVYRSIDAGASWTSISSGLTNRYIRRLAIDPLVPSTLYAATDAGKVFRTANAGETWSDVSAGLPAVVPEPYFLNTPYSLAIDPATPSTLYYSSGQGLYRTTNSGATWMLHDSGIPAGRDGTIYSLAIHPVTSSTVYAGGRGRVFRSTDSGVTWSQISNETLHQNAGRQALVIDPLVPTTLYYSGNEVSSGGVWRSVDGGVNWTHQLGGPIGSLAVDPVAHTTVYAGTFFAGVWKSVDSGDTWARADTGMFPRGQIHALAISTLLPGRLYAASLGGPGIFRTDDGAATWGPANGGLFAATVPVLKVDPTTPSTLFAFNGGISRSTDMGRSWTNWASGAYDLAFDVSHPGTMYIATPLGVSRTRDRGTTWVDALAVGAAVAVAVDPITPATVYALLADGSVYRSTSEGESWANASTGLPVGTATPTMQLLIDPGQPSTLYVSWGGRVYKTVNGGEGWAEAGPPDSISTLAISPSNPAILYAATFTLGVFRTTNGGGTWTPAGSGLPAILGGALVVDPSNSANVYVSSVDNLDSPGAGIFRSTNHGSTWAPFNVGLTDLSVPALAFDPFTPSVLYAGTDNGSAFRWQPAGVRRLAVTKPGTGTGTVTSSPGGIQCGSDCVEEHSPGTVVTLNAVAESPSMFVSFGGDPDCLDGVVTLSDNRTCTAIFNLPTFSLSVAKNGTGAGTVSSSPIGINCGSDCQESYSLGSVVTLTANPATGSVFTSWAGACTGTAQNCQVTMTQARSVTATFHVTPPAAFAKVSPANGTTGLPWVNGALIATLSWQATARASSYEYCYDTTNNNTCDGTWVNTPAIVIFTSQLNVATTYFWQVRAVNIGGSTEANGGAWWSFRTAEGSPPGSFLKTAPLFDSVVQPAAVQLSWQSSAGATSYEYCYVRSLIQSCPTAWTSTAATTAVLTGLTPGAAYSWQVRARNANGTADAVFWWTFNTAGGSEDLALDFGPSLGLWILGAASSWQQLHGLSPDAMMTGDLDGNGVQDLVIDFGVQLGVWAWMNHASWAHIHGLSPTLMTIGDLDGNGQDDAVFDFPGMGLWRFSNNGAWSQLNGASAAHLAVANLDGTAAKRLVVSFPGAGLWIYRHAIGWSLLHGMNVVTLRTADTDANGFDDVVISFSGGLGLWTYRSFFGWTQLHGLSPIRIASGRLDGNNQDDLVVDFGPGMGVWILRNRSSWALVHGSASEGIVLLDRDGDTLDDIVIDFGPAIGLWQYGDDGAWSILNALSPEVMAAGRLR